MDQTDAQDALRPARQFLSLVGDMFAIADNSYASQDYYPANQPRGYQTIGPFGLVSVEGTTAQIIATTPQGGLVISPTVILVALGFAAAMFWKR